MNELHEDVCGKCGGELEPNRNHEDNRAAQHEHPKLRTTITWQLAVVILAGFFLGGHTPPLFPIKDTTWTMNGANGCVTTFVQTAAVFNGQPAWDLYTTKNKPECYWNPTPPAPSGSASWLHFYVGLQNGCLVALGLMYEGGTQIYVPPNKLTCAEDRVNPDGYHWKSSSTDGLTWNYVEQTTDGYVFAENWTFKPGVGLIKIFDYMANSMPTSITLTRN